MGWTVLYIAFGIVALWLLGEVLLQYKARLRWRALAFTGFLGVVLGVLMPNIIVIVLGAIAFAAGQTFVTLSFRRGFSTGWALGGSPGESRRRKGAPRPAAQEPSLEVSDLEYEQGQSDQHQPGQSEPFQPPEESASVYAPEPLPDETGQYGVYSDAAYAASRAGAAPQPNQPGEYGGYGAYPGYDQPADQGAYATQEPYAGQDAYAAQTAYAGQDPYAAQQYDYGNNQQQYAAYSDPYIGSTTGGQQYGGYDNYGGQQQYADPYPGQAGQEYGDTPPGGVWVPQQREGDPAASGTPPMPPQNPDPYGYDPNYNGRQQY
ncbi:hypothetical protein QR77_08915 [Streptomyces sp. 150FB]|uniref:hypothetical protein n=1 Tax=Streptomyces sp. 150FB TaxID=1576605 RepID=UPI0005895F48|nr:hypothetical protein [Streptomyces sp. 150FB]KIF74077.1 hypothetical protein QR77_08915 [Streptomyces sp. 150FB]